MKKIHVFVWRFKVASCKRDSLKSIRFSRKYIKSDSCIVLMGWSLLPNALRPFSRSIVLPPNLGITRTWICQLILLRSLFFQAWGSLRSLKSQTREPRLKIPPKGLMSRVFMSWKNTKWAITLQNSYFVLNDHRRQPVPPGPPSIDNGAHGTEKVLLNPK